jgi:hypothetical protein
MKALQMQQILQPVGNLPAAAHVMPPISGGMQ